VTFSPWKFRVNKMNKKSLTDYEPIVTLTWLWLQSITWFGCLVLSSACLIGRAAHHLWCGCEARCCTRLQKRAPPLQLHTHGPQQLSTTQSPHQRTQVLFFFTIFQDFLLCISIFKVKLFIVDDFWEKIFSIFSPKFDIKKLYGFKQGTMTPHRFFQPS